MSGQIARCSCGSCRRASAISLRVCFELAPRRARQMSTFAPAAAIFSAAALPMPDEPPVISTMLPCDLAAQRVVDEQVGIEMALPVVPQLPGVVLQIAARGSSCPSSARSVSRAVEARRVVDELERRPAGMPRSRSTTLVKRFTGGSLARRLLHRRRDEAEHARVEAHRHLRRMAGAREDVEHLADAPRRRDR